MARKKKRKKTEIEEGSHDLNLIPMMNLVLLLIPVILITASFVEITVINVAAPQIGGGAPTEQEKPEKPPLNLTIVLTDQGFTIAGSGGVLGQAEADPNAAKGPTIPKSGDGKYDWEGLTRKLVEIKDAFPEETKVIINAEPDIKYEFLVGTMDAARETKDRRELFPDVVLSAGIS